MALEFLLELDNLIVESRWLKTNFLYYSQNFVGESYFFLIVLLSQNFTASIEIEKKPPPKCADVEPQIKYAMSLINNLSHVIKEGRLDTKRELIGVMFPEKFDFDGKSYRTNSYNKVLDLICQQTNELRG